jgi:hypothetical protein
MRVDYLKFWNIVSNFTQINHPLTMILNSKTILIILIAFVFSSCKKEEEEESNIRFSQMNESLKSNFSFNEGSYWIYKKDSSHIDSVVLTNSENGYTSTCMGSCSRNEFIKLKFHNVTQGDTFNHYLWSNHMKYNGGGNWGEIGQPIYIVDKEKGYDFNGLIVGQTYDSLEIAGTFYYDVEKMTVLASQQYEDVFDYDRDFYFVPSVGIVRKVIYNSQLGAEIWDLTKYKTK